MKLAFKILRYSGLAFFFREYFQRNKLSILMFHDIDRKTAKQSFEYLAKKYNIISLQTYLQARQSGDLKALPSKAMIITFDDGHKQNYEIYPILQSLGVPATIFLCSGIVDTHRHYWFKENKTGQSTDSLKKLSHQERLQQLDAAGFQPEKEFEERQALTSAEILEMKSAIDFQGHTVFHPCLPTCTPAEAKWEIDTSKRELASKYDLKINAFAYPNGDYSDRDINLLKEAGYQLAVTVDHGYNDANTDLFRLKRLSSNDTSNMDELIVKASGLWGFIKKLSGNKPGHGWTDEVTPAKAKTLSINK